MRKSILEQLAERGVIVIQKKGGGWLVDCIQKDEAGYLINRHSTWGKNFDEVLADLLEKATLAE